MCSSDLEQTYQPVPLVADVHHNGMKIALEVAKQLQPTLETNNNLEEQENLTLIPEDNVNTVIIKEKEPVIIYRKRRTYSRPSRRRRRRR